MKYITHLLCLTPFLLCFLIGCGDTKPRRFNDNPAGRRQLVVYTLETDEVAVIPDTYNGQFIARTKDGILWYVVIRGMEIHTKHPLMTPTIIQSKVE